MIFTPKNSEILRKHILSYFKGLYKGLKVPLGIIHCSKSTESKKTRTKTKTSLFILLIIIILLLNSGLKGSLQAAEAGELRAPATSV
jgi:hypothetical protein